MRVADCITCIEAVADPARAASWDRCGVQIAGTVPDCTRLAVALDPLPGMIEEALDWGAQLVLTHHPLALAPRLPDRLDDLHRVLTLVLGRGATLYSAHTSLDVVTDGPAGWLAQALELQNQHILEPAGSVAFLALRFALPQGSAGPDTLAALTALPQLAVSQPGEHLLEVACPPGLRARVEAILAETAPGSRCLAVTQLAQPSTPYGYGLVGDLPQPLAGDVFLKRLAALLPRSFFTLAGCLPATVGRMAYCPGSGADMAARAFAAGATVYVTGDLKYHQAQAVPAHCCLVDVGHFSLEEVMMRRFAADLAATFGQDGPEVRYFAGTDPITAHFPDGTAAPRTE
ncbi:Nif3-like dinuclear metal center hexameric protein [Desulfovibrio aerotolerans]|uniref:GTP cyclohydrolase 1 type 2 homolog n=1 Tax=Solidesulfovibrio aerotolerans TaxID=295255 RepID=A0A7C9MKU0_9BACT|nr:Nif3-like dinuclear metal center hexameric protein [Solidesulfovibrio aerotolerans]MYL84948.1 Nif3-like dinuclear metal center hexameric protein [Solidesulfovibrio aerotolerans]